MRILRFLFSSIVIVAVATALLFLLSREVLLFIATQQIENDLSELGVIKKNPLAYVQKCKAKGTIRQTNVIARMQLRFSDERTYATEVLCDQFPNDPVVIQKKSLPLLVEKAPGYSGVIWGDQASGIVLMLWGRQRRVGVVEQVVQSSPVFSPGQLQPATTCRGFSQFCCQAETQLGEGEVNTQATDCAQSCYRRCVRRPVVLSFNSDPFFDQETRTLELDTSTAILFPYVVESPNSTKDQPPQVLIDYGDGSHDEASTFTGQFTHTYACVGRCRFTVSIRVRDHLGRESVITPLSSMTVIVTASTSTVPEAK